MSILAYEGGLALKALPASGYTPVVGDLVYISGDKTVAKAVANSKVIGYINFANANIPEYTVEVTKAEALKSIVVSADVSAGGLVKMAALSGSVQRVAPWVSGTDVVENIIGIVWKGATTGNAAEILLLS